MWYQQGVLWFVVWMFSAAVLADIPDFRFDVLDPGPDDVRVPVIEPWAKIPLDPHYAGQWIVTGDVDGDGQVDIVSAQNVSENDVHYNRNDVVLLTDGFLVQLKGSTGRELRRFSIPAQAADCLVFANLSGSERATDVLVKNRYSQIWALDRDGNQLWTVREPGGYRTAHQPRLIDLDGDGIDEIMAGYAMLNADGSLRWTYQSQAVDQARGHLDACRIFNLDPEPARTRLVLTWAALSQYDSSAPT